MLPIRWCRVRVVSAPGLWMPFSSAVGDVSVPRSRFELDSVLLRFLEAQRGVPAACGAVGIAGAPASALGAAGAGGSGAHVLSQASAGLCVWCHEILGLITKGLWVH